MFCPVTKWIKKWADSTSKEIVSYYRKACFQKGVQSDEISNGEISLVLVEFSRSRADLREDGESTRSGIKTASAFRGKRGSRHLGVIRHRWGVVQM